MRTTFARWIMTGLIAAVVLASGCSSCEQQTELPSPVPQEGRLPRAPQPAMSPPILTPPPPACAVVATASVEEGAAPLTVHFSGEGMCTDAEGVFTWDFGDGSAPAHEQSPVHTYEKPGTYKARVTLVDDAHHAHDADEVPITVTAP